MTFPRKNLFGSRQQQSLFLLTAFMLPILTGCSSAPIEEPKTTSSPQPAASKSDLPELPAIFKNTNSGISQDDYAKALKGDHDAQYKVGYTCRFLEPPIQEYDHMSIEQKKAFYIPRNRMAFDFIARAAGGGHFEAQKELAVMYETGFGTDASFKSAKKWFEIALKTAKQSKKADDIEDAKSNLEALAEDIKASTEVEKEEADLDRQINERLSQFTDSFRMRDLIGHSVTLDIPPGNIKRLWAAKSFSADLDFFTAYINNDTIGMQTLIDSGVILEISPNTKALLTAYDKSSEQVHVHIQSGSAIGKDLMVMYNFIRP